MVNYDIELENGVLGCCFIAGEIAEIALEILAPEDFYESKNELIFMIIKRLSESGREISLVTIADELNQKIEGAAGYISKITESFISTSSLRVSCQILKDKSIRRRMERLALNIPELSARSETVQDFIEKVDQEYNEVLNVSDSAKCLSVGETIQPLMRTIELAHSGDKPLGIRTGFSSLDDIFRLMPTRYYVIAARTSIGKTSFALALANNIASDGVPVLYVSLEMSAKDLTLKLTALRAGFSPAMAQMGRLNSDGMSRFVDGCEGIESLPIYIDDRRQMTMTQIRITARRMKRKHNIGVIFIDHLTKIRHAEGTRDYRIGLNQISNDISVLAYELNVPIVTLAQISRGAEKRDDKRPQLADIKESGAIEEDCDLAIGLYRDDYYTDNYQSYSELEATILKNREGKSRVTAKFHVDKSTGKVDEIGEKI